MAWLVFHLLGASHAPASSQILLLIGSRLRPVASLCTGWAFPFLLSLSHVEACVWGKWGWWLKKKNKANFFLWAGTQGDRCSWEMAAVGQSKGITAACADTPKPTQNEFAWVAIEPWPCMFGSGCHTYSAAGAGVSSPEMAPGVFLSQAEMETGPWAPSGAAAPLALSAKRVGWSCWWKWKGKIGEEIPAFYTGLSSAVCGSLCSYLHWDNQQRICCCCVSRAWSHLRVVQVASRVKGSGDLAHSEVDFKKYHLCFPSKIRFGLTTLELPAHLHLVYISVCGNFKFTCTCVPEIPSLQQHL